MRKQVILMVLFLSFLSGCNILAYPAYLIFGDHNPKIEAEYDGLVDMHIALMIVGHPGIDFEFPYITTNLALMGANLMSQKVEGVSFVEQKKIDAFLQQSSQWIGLDRDRIKNKFNAQQLIYIELVRLTLLEENSVNLLRGRLIANLKVYDLQASPNDQEVYETDIQIIVPEAAAIYASDSARQQIEQKLMIEFAIRLAYKFYDHREER
jgi:hypothetical protein